MTAILLFGCGGSLADDSLAGDEGLSSGKGDETRQSASGRYAILVRTATRDEATWAKVVAAAEQRHPGARVFTFTEQPDEARPLLRAFAPRYLAVIERPDRTTPEFTRQVHDLAETLDEDPYVDAIWGIITGLTAEDALALVAPDPIVVKRGLIRTGYGWLNYLREGLYFIEDQANPGVWGEKVAGMLSVLHMGGAADDTSRFMAAINSDKYQLIVGSGHGDHDRWQLTYSKPQDLAPPAQRYMVADADGKLSVSDDRGNSHAVATSNPKIYWAVGNCLTGFIHGQGADGKAVDYHDSFALAWMRKGVKNYLGATDKTRYPTFWFHSNYWFSQQDRFSYAESIFLLRQQIHYELLHGLGAEGDKYTEAIMVLYGDPALDARLAPERDPSLDEKTKITALADGRVRIQYTARSVASPLRLKRGEKGWRVYATLLPRTLSDVVIERSDFQDAQVTGETLIWDSGTPLVVGESRTVVLTGTTVK